jgi:excisionase family DNA binding protein
MVPHSTTPTLTRRQAAEYVGVSVATLDRLVARGELPPPRRVSVGASRYLAAELADWLAARPPVLRPRAGR